MRETDCRYQVGSKWCEPRGGEEKMCKPIGGKEKMCKPIGGKEKIVLSQ